MFGAFLLNYLVMGNPLIISPLFMAFRVGELGELRRMCCKGQRKVAGCSDQQI